MTRSNRHTPVISYTRVERGFTRVLRLDQGKICQSRNRIPDYDPFFAADLPRVRAALETNVPVRPPLALSIRQTKRPFVFRKAPLSENVASTLSPSMVPLTS